MSSRRLEVGFQAPGSGAALRSLRGAAERAACLHRVAHSGSTPLGSLHSAQEALEKDKTSDPRLRSLSRRWLPSAAVLRRAGACTRRLFDEQVCRAAAPHRSAGGRRHAERRSHPCCRSAAASSTRSGCRLSSRAATAQGCAMRTSPPSLDRAGLRDATFAPIARSCRQRRAQLRSLRAKSIALRSSQRVFSR